MAGPHNRAVFTCGGPAFCRRLFPSASPCSCPWAIDSASPRLASSMCAASLLSVPLVSPMRPHYHRRRPCSRSAGNSPGGLIEARKMGVIAPTNIRTQVSTSRFWRHRRAGRIAVLVMPVFIRIGRFARFGTTGGHGGTRGIAVLVVLRRGGGPGLPVACRCISIHRSLNKSK